MASDKDASCANDPEFAVICAFLEKFSEDLQVEYPEFKQLEDWLMNTDEVPNGLRDLHIKLMRKTRRTVHECAWETALSKFCFSYSSQDGWEIERFGYKKSSLKVKLRILRELLESQFDRNNKFRAKLLTMSADSLRSKPIGCDRLGHAYWFTQDTDCNIRIYQEHSDEEIWQVVATNREELVKLISRLKGNEVVLPSEIGVVDEDSSSNSCSVPIIKPPPPEEKDDSQESNQSTEGRIPNIKIKLGNKENGVVVKSETVMNVLENRENGNTEKEEEKKVKPLVISHSKITMEKSKKRPLEESDRSEPEQIKKQRPTLLDSKREKKLSKYEKAKQEDDEEGEGSEEDSEEEEEGDEDTGGEGEEEDDDGEEEADGEEGEEEGDEEEDAEDADDADEEEEVHEGSSMVGEALEDPPVIVKGEGSGEECESSYFHHLPSNDFDVQPEFSEVIEETTLFVTGEGAGTGCLVGNAKASESEPKATFFFGQPGCLKLSPLKNQPKTDEPPNCQEEEKKPTEPSNGENHSEPVEETAIEQNEETPESEKPEQTVNSSEERRPTKSAIINRKRRLSEEKPEKLVRRSSESETDPNSEILDDQILDADDDVDHGGKRPKMRAKITNTDMRKKVEAQRKNATVEETTSSSGEDDQPRKKIVPRKAEKEVEKVLPLKTKLKQAAIDLSDNAEPVEAAIKKEEIETPAMPEQATPPAIKAVETITPINNPSVVENDKVEELQIEEPKQEILQEPSTEPSSIPYAQEPEIPAILKNEDIPPPESIELNPEPPPEDHIAVENQRKRRSSEDESEVKEPSVPPPVPVKTRFSRRSGPPEHVGELPLPKRTRVKATNPNNHPVKKDPTLEPTKPKTKAAIRAQSLKTPIKQEELQKDPDPIPDETDLKPTEELEVKAEVKLEEKPKPVSTIRPRQQAAQKQPASAQRRKQHDAIDTKNIIDVESEITPVRQSRRIAQLKIREEAERRKMEEIALRNMKAELKKKKKAEKADDPTVSEPSEHSSDHEDSEVEVKKKTEKKKKCPGKGGWSSGSEEPEEEEEEQYESDPGSPLFKSDHEFSPESELEDESQVVPLKRARTARKEGDEVVTASEVDESCQKCGKSDHPEWILLCDKCDKGYHCSCLSPVLFYIPEGDWFCPPCQQEELIIALENHLKEFDDLVERKKEEEERIRLEVQARLELEKAAQAKRVKRTKQKQARQRKKSYGGARNQSYRKKAISDDDEGESDESVTETDASNASKSVSSKSDSSKSNSTTDSDDEPIYKLRKRRQINVSYRLNEYDDMIKSALKEEEDEVAGAGNLGRGKDISTIIEADKEEKLRQQQQQQRIAEENGDVTEEIDKPPVPPPAAEDSGSDFEPQKRKPKRERGLKKKARKLTTLDISSEGDNDSDEDFKTSSMDDDDEEDEEEEEEDSQSSDSSLDMYRRRHRRGKGKKKTRRAARRAARERRKDRKFIVEDSEFSDEEDQPRSKKKRKKDSDYSESETNDDEDELSENIDSDELCDDSTESEASDDAWRPSKRKKQRSHTVARKSPKLKSKSSSKAKRTKRVEHSGTYKPLSMKSRAIRDDSEDEDSDDSFDSSRKTRGKKCLYLEDYEDDSSDGGIKPGVKRPDTPPEEREQFIKKQEEIKRMLAEKNAEGAKLAATPRLVPIKGGAQKSPAKLDSLSTVPQSVIRQAKALDVDYLQRKGESISEGDLDESEFDDDDLPDFSPEDMDEEAIARMVEEEDFAQQQLKLPNPAEVLRKKPSREMETVLKSTQSLTTPQPPQSTISSASGLQEPIRKKLPMPTIHPPLLRHGYGPPSQHMLHQNRSSGLQHLPLLQNALSAPLNHPGARSFPPATQAIPATNQGVASQLQSAGGSGGGMDPNKPRGRRKKITPLRDPLEKQQAAAAASAAAAAASKPRIDNISTSKADDKSTPGPIPVSVATSAPAAATPGVIKSALSIAQPPQLYKPLPAVNAQPSVITRMPHLQGRPMMPVGSSPFPEQGSRFYRPPPPQSQQQPPPPNALIPGSRPPLRHRNQLMPPMTGHHTLRPSYVGGPPPLRSANSGPPISLANDIREQGANRQSSTYSGPEQYAPPPARHTAPSHLSPYRPQMYGSPGFPQRGPPTNSSQPSNMRPAGAPPEYSSPGSYVSGYGYYPPPSLSVPHSAPPPPTASAVPSSVIVSASSLVASATVPSAPLPPSQVAVPSRPPASSPSLIEKPLVAPVTATVTPPSVIELSRKPKLTTLETFSTSKVVAAATPPPPLTESSESHSPYSSNPPTVAGVDDAPDENSGSPITGQQSTSEFSGLVSYFSSQHDDLNT